MSTGELTPDPADPDLQAELGSLEAYVHDTRSALAGLQQKLPSASSALDGVTQATEQATHNILALVEELMDRDSGLGDAVAVLQRAVGQGQLAPEVAQATQTIAAAQEHRGQALVQLMTELSFQDLTSQALNRISNTLEHIEQRLHAIVTGKDQAANGRHRAESLSGLERLQERDAGKSSQNMVDALFK